MPRNFNLSGIGLGIYLLGCGISYTLHQTCNINVFSFWFRLYPVLAILLGLDFILANTHQPAVFQNQFKLIGKTQGDTFWVSLQMPERLNNFKIRHLNTNITLGGGPLIKIRNKSGNIQLHKL
jgi:hypothetical protein